MRRLAIQKWKRADVIALATCIVALLVGIPAWIALRHPDNATNLTTPAILEKPKYDDPVKEACMNGSAIDCNNYAGHIFVKCNQYDQACKLLVMCWQDKARALTIVDEVCNKHPNAESCEFQKKNLRASIEMDCDKKTLDTY